MAYVLNNPINEAFILRDYSNVAITGKTNADFATVEAYEVGTPATTAAVTITEIGGGEYRASFTPTTAAVWTLHIVYNSGGVFQEFSGSYDVQASASTVTVIASAASGALTLTLTEIRRRVARRFGDYTSLTATANGDVGKTTLIDTLNVNSGTEDMKGRILLFTNGSNNGLTRRVTTQDDSAGTLTFTPAATAQTATNDTFDVFNKRGKGFTPDEYKSAINDAINDAYPLGLIEVRATVSPAFAFATPEVTVPAALTYVHTVEWEDEDGYWTVVPRATHSNQYGWIADAAAGEIRILGSPGYGIDGLTVRLTGYGRQAELSAESDTCALNAEYVVSRACYHLALSAIDKDSKFGQMVGVFLNESQKLRTRIRTLGSTGTRGEPVRAA